MHSSTKPYTPIPQDWCSSPSLELDVRRMDHGSRQALDALDIVNFRAMGAIHGPAEGTIAEQVNTLAELKREGLIRHISLSNVTASQVTEAQAITDIVCVQNNYNLANRGDDSLIDDLARQDIA